MATQSEFIVNKKFLLVFVALQFIIAGIILYALISPKTVTVQVEKLENSFSIERPLLNSPPRPSV